MAGFDALPFRGNRRYPRLRQQSAAQVGEPGNRDGPPPEAGCMRLVQAGLLQCLPGPHVDAVGLARPADGIDGGLEVQPRRPPADPQRRQQLKRHPPGAAIYAASAARGQDVVQRSGHTGLAPRQDPQALRQCADVLGWILSSH